jgi:hypothetical protein
MPINRLRSAALSFSVTFANAARVTGHLRQGGRNLVSGRREVEGLGRRQDDEHQAPSAGNGGTGRLNMAFRPGGRKSFRGRSAPSPSAIRESFRSRPCWPKAGGMSASDVTDPVELARELIRRPSVTRPMPGRWISSSRISRSLASPAAG